MNKKIIKKIDKAADVLGRAMIFTLLIVLATEFIIIGIFWFKLNKHIFFSDQSAPLSEKIRETAVPARYNTQITTQNYAEILEFLRIKTFYANAQIAPNKKAVNPANVPQIAVPVGDFYRECAVCASEDTPDKQNDCYAKFDSTKCFDVQHPENWIGQYVQAWFNYLVGAIGIIAVVMVMWGGIKWITSGGNSSQIEEAKGKIKNAVIGIILLLGAYTIFTTVNPQLLNLSLPPIEKVVEPIENCCQNIATKIKSLRYKCFADEEERKDITDPSLCEDKITKICTKDNTPLTQKLYNTNQIQMDPSSIAPNQLDPKNSCGHFNYDEKCIYIKAEDAICIITEEKDGNLASGRISSRIPALKGFWDSPRSVGKDGNCGESYLTKLLGMYIGSNCLDGKICWAKQKYNNDRPYEFYCDNTLMKTFETNGSASADTNKAQIRAELESAGIGFNYDYACSPGQTSGCTSVAGMREETVEEVFFLAEQVGPENVIISGGTEDGHSTLHKEGFKFDIFKTAQVTTYVKDNAKTTYFWSDGTKVYVMANSAKYAEESDHWDVCVNCASG